MKLPTIGVILTALATSAFGQNAPTTQPLVIPDDTADRLVPPLPGADQVLPPELWGPRHGRPLDPALIRERNEQLRRWVEELMRQQLGQVQLQLDALGGVPLVAPQVAPAVEPPAQAPLKAEDKLEKAPYLGVTVAPVPAALRDQLKVPKGQGLLVDDIDKDSPAQEAGLKPHDVILKLDDQKLVNAQQLMVLIRQMKPGDTVVLTVIHEGKTASVTAKLTEKEVPELAEDAGPWLKGPERATVKAVAPIVPGRVLPRPVQPGLVVPGGVWMRGEGISTTVTTLNGQTTKTQYLRGPDGDAVLTTRNDAKHFVAKDPDGKVLFDGPVNTDEDRRKVPEQALGRLEKLEAASAGIRVNRP